MKIKISNPEGPYVSEVDTGVNNVTIREAFLGASFVTENGEQLSVSMRDTGFEVHYAGEFGDDGFDAGWTEFKNGLIRAMPKMMTPSDSMEMSEERFDVQEDLSSRKTMADRLTVWDMAVQMVNPIFEKHGVEPYRTGTAFGLNSTRTKVEQHLDEIFRVCDWILGVDADA